MRYILRLLNFKENIFRDLCVCKTYDEMYARLLHEIIYTAGENDIITANIYCSRRVPDGSIIYRYEGGVLYHHLWSVNKTIDEIIKTEEKN